MTTLGKINIDKIALNLLGIYIFSLSLLEVWTLPVFGTKIQPPEVIFLLIISCLTLNFRYLPKPKFQKNFLTIPIIGYVLATVLSVAFSQYAGAYFELINLFYLLFLLSTIVYILVNLCEDIPAFIFKWFTYLGVFMAVTGICGWVVYQCGMWTPLVRSGSTYYPYFGYVGRVQGLTLTPGMYITIISISILLLSAKMLFDEATKWDFASLILMLIAAFLTLSKSLVLLLVGLIYLFQKRYLTVGQGGVVAVTKWQKTVKVALKITSIFLVIFAFFATHFIILKQESGSVSPQMRSYVQPNEPIANLKNQTLYLSDYGHLKIAAFQIGLSNPFFGVGKGGFIYEIPKMKQKNSYPHHFISLDPHSTYFGAWAEMGMFGLLALSVFFVTIGQIGINLNKQELNSKSWLTNGLIACFLVFGLEAFYTDIMNFRHYWFLLAVLVAFFMKNLYKSENSLRK